MVQSGLEFEILLPQTSKCWDERGGHHYALSLAIFSLLPRGILLLGLCHELASSGLEAERQ